MLQVELPATPLDLLLRSGAVLLGAWVVHAVHKLTIEVRAFRVTLFGESGANGLQGDVKRLHQQTEHQGWQLEELSRDVAVIQERLPS